MTLQILLDVDGVLADFTGAACAQLSEVLGRKCHASEAKEWEFRDSFNLDDKQQKAFQRRIASKGFCEGIPLMPNAIEAVERLGRLGEIVFVTSPWPLGKYWIAERSQWLRDNFDVAVSDVIYTDQKHRITGDVIIDDRPQNVLGGSRKLRVLVPNAANANIAKCLRKTGSDVLVTDNWSRIYREVRENL